MTFEAATRILVMGQGYVGLPLSMRAVEVGADVTGYDPDTERVKRLNAGESYVEDVSSTELAAAIASGRYRASSEAGSCAGFDVAVITVPTPLREGNPDLSFIEDAVTTLARYLESGATVILESTTYPGTTEELVAPALEAGSGLVAGKDFFLGYSPERIDPGNATHTFVTTPKVVSGIDEASLSEVRGFYDAMIDETIPVSSPRVAEMVKLLENTFRHVNVALVNEMAMFAADLGVDVWEAVEAADTKPFGFMKFTPGPGVGGHCLPIDPSYLSWRVRRVLNQPFRFVELANDVNANMPAYVVNRLMLALNRQGRAVNGSRILALGLAYKRNTSDARESPAVAVAERLASMGAVVSAVDPHVVEGRIDSRISMVELTAEAVAESDAVVLLTDHDNFDLDVVARSARLVLDTRHRVPAGANVEYL